MRENVVLNKKCGVMVQVWKRFRERDVQIRRRIRTECAYRMGPVAEAQAGRIISAGRHI
jgi:hypothetical protein